MTSTSVGTSHIDPPVHPWSDIPIVDMPVLASLPSTLCFESSLTLSFELETSQYSRIGSQE